MPALLKFLVRRIVVIPITLFFITAILYGVTMLAPPERRAYLYLPTRVSTADILSDSPLIKSIIQKYHLDDPYPVQYFSWLSNLLQGDWGYSPTARRDVLELLVTRTPVTAELMLYTALLFIPLGLASGVVSAARQGRRVDHGFRLAAFIGTSIPPFVMALVLLSIFYVGLRAISPGRVDPSLEAVVKARDWHMYTGLMTLDGFLNGRADISLDALKHLILPVFTLGLAHWATLGRVTRVSMIEELDKEYVVAAEGKGLRPRRVLWVHALRNAMLPALTSSALSAASLVTGVYVVEIMYNLHGISDIFSIASQKAFGVSTFDPAPALGFAVYSVFIVLIVMLVMDVIQAIVDPRIRERLAEP